MEVKQWSKKAGVAIYTGLVVLIIPGNAGERVSCGCRDDGDLIITRVNFEEEIALQL